MIDVDNIEIKIKENSQKKSIQLIIESHKVGRCYHYDFPKTYPNERAILEILAREFGYDPAQLFNFEGE